MQGWCPERGGQLADASREEVKMHALAGEEAMVCSRAKVGMEGPAEGASAGIREAQGWRPRVAGLLVVLLPWMVAGHWARGQGQGPGPEDHQANVSLRTRDG